MRKKLFGWKRLLAGLTAAVLVLTGIPATSFADEIGTEDAFVSGEEEAVYSELPADEEDAKIGIDGEPEENAEEDPAEIIEDVPDIQDPGTSEAEAVSEAEDVSEAQVVEETQAAEETEDVSEALGEEYEPVRVFITASAKDLFTYGNKGIALNESYQKITTGKEIQFTISYTEAATEEVLAGYNLTYAYYRGSEESDQSLWHTGDLGEGFIISKEYVEAAEQNGDSIIVNLTASEKKVTVTLDDADGVVKYYGYTPVTMNEDNEWISGDVQGNELRSYYPFYYGADFYYGDDFRKDFVVVVSDEYKAYFTVESIKVNQKIESPKTDSYKKDGDWVTSTPYYRIENITEDIKVTPVFTPSGLPEGTSFTLNDTGAEHSKFSIAADVAKEDAENAGRYVFEQGAGRFGFTVTTDWNYVPVAETGHVESGEFVSEKEYAFTERTVNEKDKTITYTWSGLLAGLFDGKVLRITEKQGSTLYCLTKIVGAQPFAPEENETIPMGPYDTADLRVFVGAFGSGPMDDIEKVTVKKDKKEVKGLAKIADDNGQKYVYLDASDVEGGSKPYEVTVEGGFGKRTINVKVGVKISSVSVKGAKQNKITQTAGTEKAYTVTLNSGADYERIGLKYDYTRPCEFRYEAEEKKLYVKTYRGEEITTEPMEVTFESGEAPGEAKPIATFTIEPAAPKLPAPSVKTVIATDIDMFVHPELPKSLQSVSNLFYKIELKAAGKRNEKMKESVTTYAFPNHEEWIYLGDTHPGSELKYGQGGAQKYTIKVSLIQLKNTGVDSDQKFEAANIYKAGAVKTLKDQSTKDPRYETNLKLNKKTASFTLGKENVLLATAKFSAKTSYVFLAAAELLDSAGEVVTNSDTDHGGCLDIDQFGRITLKEAPAKLTPGKYTLYVYPLLRNNLTYCVPATMTVTVKTPVTDVKLTPGGDDSDPVPLTKKKDKALSFKISAKCTNRNKGAGKPANTKVKWTCGSDNPALAKALSVKNGKVTVAKSYVPSDEPDENLFWVQASACDLGDASASSQTVFRLKKYAVTPIYMEIYDIPGVEKDPEAHISGDFHWQKLTVFDQNSGEINNRDFSVSVSPKNGFKIDPDGTVLVTKPGTYTVKVVMKDGGKKSLSRKFAVKNVTLYEEKPYLTGFSYMIGETTAPLLLTDGKASAEGAETILCTVTPMISAAEPAASIAKNDTTVTFTGAKTIPIPDYAKASLTENSPCMKIFMLRPTGDKVTAKVSYKDKDGKKVEEHYEIAVINGAGKLIPKKKGYSFYANLNVNTYFVFDTKDTDLSGNILLLSATPQEDVWKKKELSAATQKLCEQITKEGKVFPNPDGSIWVDFASTALKDIGKGEYKVYLTLWGGSGKTDMHSRTAPVKVTFKVSAAPKPTAALNSKVTMKRTDEEAKLTFKSLKNLSKVEPVSDKPTVWVDVLDDNKDGQVNDFSDFFSAYVDDENGDEPYIVLKREIEIPQGVTSMSGWIRYRLVGKDGHTKVVKTERITVKFE